MDCAIQLLNNGKGDTRTPEEKSSGGKTVTGNINALMAKTAFRRFCTIYLTANVRDQRINN